MCSCVHRESLWTHGGEGDVGGCFGQIWHKRAASRQVFGVFETVDDLTRLVSSGFFRYSVASGCVSSNPSVLGDRREGVVIGSLRGLGRRCGSHGAGLSSLAGAKYPGVSPCRCGEKKCSVQREKLREVLEADFLGPVRLWGPSQALPAWESWQRNGAPNLVGARSCSRCKTSGLRQAAVGV
jgi:hypothetical protein